MSTASISDVAGAYSVRHHRHRRQTGDASSQTSDQTQTQPATNSASTISASSPAPNSLMALLNDLAINASSQNDTDASQDRSSLGNDVLTMMKDFGSGDIAGAQALATSIQSQLNGSSSQSTSSTSVAESSNTSTDNISLLNDLQSLVSAVQSNDAGAVIADFTKLVEDSLTPRSHRGQQADPFRQNLAGLLQSVQSNDMSSAERYATTLQAMLDSQSTAATDGTTSGTDSSNSMLKTDIANLLSAVKSGDATASQSAASAFVNDLKNLRAARNAANAYSQYS
jgi:hypothetical protein